VTSRVLEMGTITHETEETLLELTHGDLDLTLDDSDDAVWAFFNGILPTDRFYVIVLRETGKRRPRWERIFAGTVEPATSLRFDEYSQTVSIQAFSFSKLLEAASAETLVRDFSGLTGSVTSGSSTVTISPSTGPILAGDEIRLRNGTDDEQQLVIKILTGTTVQTLSTWGTTFSSADLTCETPYPRDISPQDLAEQLATASGMKSGGVELLNPLADYPIATPLASASFPHDTSDPDGAIQEILSLTPISPNIDARTKPGGTQTRSETADPAEAWTNYTTGSVQPLQDWTPYQDTEPGSFPTTTYSPGGSHIGHPLIDDTGTFHASDHAGGHNYNIWYFYTGTPFIYWVMLARDNGPFNTGIMCEVPVTSATDYLQTSVEFDPVTGYVWVSGTGYVNSGTPQTKDFVKYIIPPGPAAFNSIETALSGKLRFLRRLNLMALHEFNPNGNQKPTPTTNLHLYDTTTRKVVRIVTVPDGLWAWSLRVWEDENGVRIAGLYDYLNTTRLRIWTEDWVEVVDYQVSGRIMTDKGTDTHTVWQGQIGHNSVFTDPNGTEMVVGYSGDSTWVLGKGYRGVIPYADLSDKSCAEAFRQLSLLTMSIYTVDLFGNIFIRGRGYLDDEKRGSPVPIDVPLSWVTRPLWERYAASAKVSGAEPLTGTTIDVVAGDTGDSAHRVELSSDFVITASLAEAVGSAYVGFFGKPRQQIDVDVPETGTLIRPLDYVSLDGRAWIVLASEFNHKNRTHSLRMVEADV